jgi:hypothetical protein
MFTALSAYTYERQQAGDIFSNFGFCYRERARAQPFEIKTKILGIYLLSRMDAC